MLLCLVVSAPLGAKAQCGCAPGETGGTIEHSFTLDTTTADLSTITFPQFPTSTGRLNCITVYDTFSVIATSGARNLDVTTGRKARFLLTLTGAIVGPSILIDEYQTRNYGPDSLYANPNPLDSVTYGPDTIFNNAYNQQTINTSSDLTPYTGYGNVNLSFEQSGGLIPTLGGTNYSLSIRTKTWGSFRIVYSWCPNSALASNIGQFTAVRKGNTIQLEWFVTNEEKSNTYEIEISYDGIHFTRAGKAAGQYAAQGTAAKYSYQYLPDPAATGTLYVRIRQTGANGKVSYSPIRTVTLDNSQPPSFVVSPNPVSDRVTLQFDRELKGQYGVELFNTAGQSLLNRSLTANGSSTLSFPLPIKPAPGVYYLRTTQLATGQLFTSKLLVR